MHYEGRREGGGKRGILPRAPCVRGTPTPKYCFKIPAATGYSAQLGLGRRLSDTALRSVRFLINVHPMSRGHHVHPMSRGAWPPRSLVHSTWSSMSNYSRLWRRQYLSGAAKRRRKRQRIESEVKRRRTLEELGWSVESGKGEDANVDEPVQPSVSGSSESE